MRGNSQVRFLGGEEGSNALDLPDRPSDLEQRNGRAIRKGNMVAKEFADNKVDVIIYAVEREGKTVKRIAKKSGEEIK